MKNKRGITLVALIITIIVLLILAGVVINMTIGNKGIIGKAQGAVDAYKNAQEKEEQMLNQTLEYMNGEYTVGTGTSSGKSGSGGGFDANTLSNKDVGEEVNVDSAWVRCDGSLLEIDDHSTLAQKRPDLITRINRDLTPIFTSADSRVQSSGSANNDWPNYYVFFPISNNSGCGWISEGGNNTKWISIDLEENTKINKMKFTNINHQDREDCVGAMIDFAIKGSYDNTNYTTIKTVTGNTHINKGEEHTYTFDEVNYRYYKIEITNGVPWWDGNSFWGFRKWELLLDKDYIKLPDNPNKFIKIK